MFWDNVFNAFTLDESCSNLQISKFELLNMDGTAYGNSNIAQMNMDVYNKAKIAIDTTNSGVYSFKLKAITNMRASSGARQS